MYKHLLFVLAMMIITSVGYSQPYVVTLPSTCTVNVSNATAFQNALNVAAAGDVICLASGTYVGTPFLMDHRSGSSSNPIVIKPQSGAHPIISGGIKLETSNYVYIRDLDVTGNNIEGITLLCHHCGAINNIVHAKTDAIGIGAWNRGAGQIVYGNVVYDLHSSNGIFSPHNIYSQHRFSVTNGYKYFVENILLDADVPPNAGTYNMHFYAEGDYTSGLWYERNISENGETLFGGKSNLEVDHHQVVKQNYFYHSNPRMMYARPTSFTFENNYVGNSEYRDEGTWGSPEPYFPQFVFPTSIKYNSFFRNDSGREITVFSYNYRDNPPCMTQPPVPACPREEGVRELGDNAAVDLNIYKTPFNGRLKAVNLDLTYPTIAGWRTATESAGNMYDLNSTTISTLTNAQFLLKNEYDDLRYNLAQYNWENLSSVSLNIQCRNIKVYNARDPFGTPVVEGYQQVQIPMSGSTFKVFIVKVSSLLC